MKRYVVVSLILIAGLTLVAGFWFEGWRIGKSTTPEEVGTSNGIVSLMGPKAALAQCSLTKCEKTGIDLIQMCHDKCTSYYTGSAAETAACKYGCEKFWTGYSGYCSGKCVSVY